jgi:hypothetical protein
MRKVRIRAAILMQLLRRGLFVLLVLCPPTVFAGSTSGTVVQYFTFEWPGVPPLFFVYISSNSANAAACGATTVNSNRWVTRADTAAGKAHMVAIMLAKTTGKKVMIVGKAGYIGNPCEDWGDTESIHMVSTAD